MTSKHRWIVAADDAGKTLLDMLSEKLPAWSRRQIKALLDKNACFVDGRVERHAKTPLRGGAVVVFEEKESVLTWHIETARILYEDQWLVVYDKPAGVESDDKVFWKELHAKWRTLRPVHRLDRDTTGAWLLAKDEKTFEGLVASFKAKKVEKHYLAVVDGEMKQEKGVVAKPLRKVSQQGRVVWGVGRGLPAETRWKCLHRGGGASVVECEPITGRTHQIRVHMASLGHPILGDFQYCRAFRCRYRAQRTLLHAKEITFPHPMKEDVVTVTAPLPRDMAEAIACLIGPSGVR